MKYIQLSKIFPDGRTLNFHKLHEINYLPDNNLVFKLGSWTNYHDMEASGTPEAVLSIPVDLGQNTVDTKIDLFLDDLLLLPEWAAGIVVDTSQPLVLVTE